MYVEDGIEHYCLFLVWVFGEKELLVLDKCSEKKKKTNKVELLGVDSRNIQ